MIWRARHPGDDRLLRGWVAERGGDPADPALAGHLAGCPACAARYDGMCRELGGLVDEGVAEADELFPPERLAASRRQIARRIENLGHVARVLSFPGRRPDVRHLPGGSGHGARWAAAAAVAGLLAGLGVGMYTGVSRGSDVTVLRAPVQAADADLPPAQAPLDEDAFLLELEMAGGSLRARALTPFDAFTPGVREVSTQLR